MIAKADAWTRTMSDVSCLAIVFVASLMLQGCDDALDPQTGFQFMLKTTTTTSGGVAALDPALQLATSSAMDMSCDNTPAPVSGYSTTCGSRWRWLRSQRGYTTAAAKCKVKDEEPVKCACLACGQVSCDDTPAPLPRYPSTTCGSRWKWLHSERGYTASAAKCQVKGEEQVKCACLACTQVSSSPPPTPSPTPSPSRPCWKTLQGVAAQEGDSVRAAVPYSLSACQRACDSDSRCLSFSACPGYGKCWLKDKRILGGEALQAPHGNCKTYYKGTCSGSGINLKLMEWNVWYKNKDTSAIASVIAANDADLVGIDELTVDRGDLAQKISAKAPGRDYAIQPGTQGWKGYGTDIFYDKNKFDVLEGGKDEVNSCGSHGGSRAANWVVLREKSSRKTLIAGGIHLSACGCDQIQECELGKLYDKLQWAQSKYPGSPLFWMGDMNDGPTSRLINNLKNGKIGQRNVVPVEDMSQTGTQTYARVANWNTAEIDFIFASATNNIRRLAGGLTGQGQYGSTFAGGADHRPIYALVEWTP